jgi:hypothetical protein
LDVEGGKDTAIDYPLMLTNAALNDPAERAAILPALSGLPINSVWLRVSGFGADATPAGIRKYISAMRDFRSLDVPLVSDGLGGMAGLAITAFRAVSRTGLQRLKIADEKLGAALAKNALRLERMGDVLENSYATEEEVTRAPAFGDIVHLRDSSRIQDERQ